MLGGPGGADVRRRGTGRRRERRPVVAGWWLVVAAATAIVVAGAYLAFGPIVATSVEVASVPAGDPGVVGGGAAETSVHGLGWASAAAISAVPMLLVAPALVIRRRRRAALVVRTLAGALLTVLALLAGMSVGLFYLPTAVLVLAAAVRAAGSPNPLGSSGSP